MKTKRKITALWLLTIALLLQPLTLSSCKSADENDRLKQELTLSPFVLETKNPLAAAYPRGRSYGVDTEAVDLYLVNLTDDILIHAEGQFYYEINLDGEWYSLPSPEFSRYERDIIGRNSFFYRSMPPVNEGFEPVAGHYRIVVSLLDRREWYHTHYAVEFYLEDTSQ